jgi:teichuronic acid biosynthesis glycosyltransferase TuaG
MEKVSVIIPTYQSAHYIRDAIDSALSQTYKNTEIIVVDDGSTDDTEDILKTYEGKIKVIKQKNSGPSKARNAGILSSSGEYIALLDSDDIWLPNKLEKQMIVFREDPSIGLVYSDSYIFSDVETWNKTLFQLGKPYEGSIHRQLFIKNFIPDLTVMIRRSFLLKAGLFNPAIVFGEDYALWLKVSKETRVGFVNEPLAKYRVHSSQLSSKEEQMVTSLILIKETELAENSDLKSLTKSELDHAYYNLYIRYAKILFLNNDIEKAQKVLNIYKSERGISLPLILMKILLFFPRKIGKIILMSWNYFRAGHSFQSTWALKKII